MYGFSCLPLLFLLISNFEILLYAQNVRLTFPCSAWLGTTGTRHFPFWLSVFKHARYQLGWSNPSCMFSLGDYLIFDPYALTYLIH